jgi:hypothetical protein
MVQQYKNLSFRLLFMSSCIQAQFGSNQKMYQLDFSFFTAFLMNLFKLLIAGEHQMNLRCLNLKQFVCGHNPGE